MNEPERPSALPEPPRWGVFLGRERVHFSIGVQTFDLHNAAEGDEESEHHLEHQRRSLEHALRKLSCTEPAPVELLANNWLHRSGAFREDGGKDGV